MGHRANFILIDNTVHTYEDQWAALGSTFAFAEGPLNCRRMVEGMRSTDELLDWAFAEAGFLLDFDRKQALVFGHPEPPDPEQLEADTAEAYEAVMEALDQGPAAFLAHVAPRWRGWTLTWDDRGVDAFAEYLQRLGVSGVKVQAPSCPEDLPPQRATVQVDLQGTPRPVASEWRAD